MAFTMYGGSISPNATIRVFIQFNNYQYTGPKVIQALPFASNTGHRFLIASDIGIERRTGVGLQGKGIVYSVAISNAGHYKTYFDLVGGDPI